MAEPSELKAALQAELKAVKEQCDDVKMGCAKKDAENAPFPVWVSKPVQRPPVAKAFDVLELPVKLIIEGLEKGQLQVKVTSDEIPEQLREKIAASVLKTWEKHRSREKGSWGIKKMLEWVEAKFSDLLLLDPECVQTYEGCDENDISMRRYAIMAPPPPPAEEEEQDDDEDDDDEDDDGEEEDEETRASRVAALATLMAEIEAGSSGKTKLTPEEIEQKKREAEEMGGKARALSKKEREALNKTRKEKSGHRMAKTGQKAHKYEGEGAASKEERKKRNEANVKKRFGLS